MFLNLFLHPQYIMPAKHIFLLSHMRANTSVLSHIIGSNENVSGYYEQHLSYYSWKSLIKQKLLFHKMNPEERSTRIYFDKLLHNHLIINNKLLQDDSTTCFFMLREPVASVKSIVALHRKVDSKDIYAIPENAVEYYITRAKKLVELAQVYSQKKPVYYLDTEQLTLRTDFCLEKIGQWLKLSEALQQNYKSFALTGKKKFGDVNAALSSGQITTKKQKYDVAIRDEDVSSLNDVYDECRAQLISMASDYVIQP